jgi:hypothetical protein
MRASLIGFTTATALILGGFAGAASVRAQEAPADPEQAIQAALAELPEADQPLAIAQRWCAVEQDHRLGSMGCPVKVILDGKPVFLCCAGCVKRANSHAKTTLSTAATLNRVNVNLSRLSESDRRFADAQIFCAIKSTVRLGATGVPTKVTIDGKPVFVCCSDCATQAARNPKDALEKLTALRAKNAAR